MAEAPDAGGAGGIDDRRSAADIDRLEARPVRRVDQPGDVDDGIGACAERGEALRPVQRALYPGHALLLRPPAAGKGADRIAGGAGGGQQMPADEAGAAGYGEGGEGCDLRHRAIPYPFVPSPSTPPAAALRINFGWRAEVEGRLHRLITGASRLRSGRTRLRALIELHSGDHPGSSASPTASCLIAPSSGRTASRMASTPSPLAPETMKTGRPDSSASSAASASASSWSIVSDLLRQTSSTFSSSPAP